MELVLLPQQELEVPIIEYSGEIGTKWGSRGIEAAGVGDTLKAGAATGKLG